MSVLCKTLLIHIALYSDCCDGSDEAQSHCTNTCKEVGAAELAALEAELAAFESGVRSRLEYIKYVDYLLIYIRSFFKRFGFQG